MSIFRRRRKWSWMALLGVALACAALLAAVVAGPGYRIGWVSLGDAFAWLRVAAWTGLAAVVVSLGGAIRARPGGQRRGFVLALAGILIGAPVFWFPFDMRQTARQVPPIHDITTDTSDPPRFEAVLALREDAPNAATYGGPEVARLQREAYPDIRTARFDVSADRALTAARHVARDLGWEIVAVSPEQGRLEATDTTTWFGFIDDVVVRIRPDRGGAVVDVRSVSRVGRSDIGKNAERIRAFLSALRESLADAG